MYTLANDVTATPGPLGVARLYFQALAYQASLQDFNCTPIELYADAVTMLTLGNGFPTMNTYWSGCSVTSGNETVTEQALAVVRSATAGQTPSWFADTYNDTESNPDLGRVWRDVKAATRGEGGFRATVVFQLRDSFGGYCDNQKATDSAFGSGVTRNPWRDGGCVPEAPMNVAATAVGSGKVNLSWGESLYDGGSPIEGYKVQWKSGTQEYDSSRQATITDFLDLQHAINGLTNDESHSIRVLAYNHNGDGAAAEVTAAPTATDTTVPVLLLARLDYVWVQLIWNEALDESSVPPSTAFTLNVNGRSTNPSVSIRGNVVTLTPGGVTSAVDSLTVSYTVPTGSGEMPLKDSAGNTAASFPTQSVRNDMIQVAFTSDPGPDKTYSWNGGHGKQDVIEAKVTFSEPVVVIGAPELKLEIGGNTRHAKYHSGSGTTALVFRYSLMMGEVDTVGIWVGSGQKVLTGLGLVRYASTKATAPARFLEYLQTDHLVDAIPPTLEIAYVTVNGNDLNLRWSETLDADSGTGWTFFEVQDTSNDTLRKVTAFSIRDSLVTLTLLSPVSVNDQLTVSYHDPFGYLPESVLMEVYYKPLTDTVGNSANRSTKTVAVIDLSNRARGAPTISGTAQVGQTLTAHTSGISDPDGLTNPAFTYQWLSDDAAIQGANDFTYTLADNDEGKAIKVEVTFNDDEGNGSSLTSEATDAVAARPNSPATGLPAIRGKAQVGETLTAFVSDIKDADGLTGATFSYQWISSDGTTDTDIPGATSANYTLVVEDTGKTVTVRVNYTDDRGLDETLTSAPTQAVEARSNSPATGAPAIIGTAQVGATLTADTSGISDADGLTGVAFTHQWFSNDGNGDAEIAGATGWTYTLADDHEGNTIKVKVSFTDGGGNAESLTSAATDVVEAAPTTNIPATGAPTISGTAQVGETLTADTTGIADEDGKANASFDYQWLADDSDIAGATGSTYTPVDGDEGKAIKVRVSYTDDAGNNETLTSAPTAPVFGDGPPGAPGKLTATVGNKEVTLSWDPPDDNGNAPATRYRIEWRVDGKDYDRWSQWGTSRSTTYTTNDRANLANGVKYYFRVKAENDDGNSYGPASEEVSATPTSGSAVNLGTPVLSDTENLHHRMIRLDWQDIEDAGWYVVQYYHLEDGEWLDLPAEGVDIAFHGSSAVVSNLHGLSWLRVGAASCDGASEWSQIEQLFGTNASDWEGVPVPEVEEGDQTEPCPVVLGTPVLSEPEYLHHSMVQLDWEDIEDAGWYVVQYYHLEDGEWLDLPAEGVDIALHGSSAVVSNLHGLSWLRVGAASCDGASEWSQIEELYGTNASDWKGVPVPEVAEGDEIEPCSEDADTPDNSPATGAPTISGTAQVGETLTANTSGIADADGLANATFSYQWLADDSDISGATNATYTLTDSEEGKAIKVRVSFTDDAGNEETLTSAATDTVAAAPVHAESAPDLEVGTPSVDPASPFAGSRFTLSVTVTNSGDEASEATWLRGYRSTDSTITTSDTEEGGQTVSALAAAGTSSFDHGLTAPSEAGTYYYGVCVDSVTNESDTTDNCSSSVQVTVSEPAPDLVVTGIAATDNIVTGGSFRVGVTVPNQGDAQSAATTLRWKQEVDGTTTEIGTAALSALTPPQGGFKTIRLTAPSTPGTSSYWACVDSVAGESDTTNNCSGRVTVTVTNNLATGAPTITGTAQVSQTLTASTSDISDSDGLDNVSYEYQWLADDTDISGATNATYTLTDSEESKAITVQVSFTDDADNEETLTSGATDTVEAAPTPNSPATGAPTISGTAQVGETLTADTSGIADADGLANATFSYQWLADDAEIAGATGLTYTLTDSEESKAIKVQVSFTDDADNGETLTSAATGAVAGAQPTEPPAKPRGLDATATHDSVTLTWDDPGDDSITGYVILRRIPGVDPEGHFDVLVADTGTAATTYTDDTVSAETRYTYRIKAINGVGTSERSRWVHIDVPAAPVPDQPTGLEATVTHGQVVLTWDDPGDDSITGYVILRRVRENDTGGDFSVLVADTGTAALTYTDDTVAAGLTYTYRIKAINEHGTSERSRWYHIDIPEAP